MLGWSNHHRLWISSNTFMGKAPHLVQAPALEKSSRAEEELWGKRLPRGGVLLGIRDLSCTTFLQAHTHTHTLLQQVFSHCTKDCTHHLIIVFFMTAQ